MHTISILSSFDLTLSAIAMVVAVYEAWLYRLRHRRAHLAVAAIALGCSAYAACMAGMYGIATEQSAQSFVRGAFLALVPLVLGLVEYGALLAKQDVSGSRLIRLSMGLFWAVLITGTDLVVPATVDWIDLSWFDHRYPQPASTPWATVFFGTGFVGVLHSLSMVYRASRLDLWTKGAFLAGASLWLGTALHDAAISTRLIQPPIYLLEYGFLGFVFAIAVMDQMQIRDVERNLEGVLGNTPDGIGMFRGEHMVFANEALAQQLNLPVAEIMRLRLRDLLHPDDWKSHGKSLIRGTPSRAELRFCQPGGTCVEVEVACFPVRVDGGSAIALLSRDLRSQKRLMAELMHMDRLASLGMLAAGVSHEVNNPLACVLGNLELAQEELEKGGDADLDLLHEELVDAMDGARRVASIVRDLRSMARPSASLQLIEVSDALRSALSLTRHNLAERTVLDVQMEAVPVVQVDEGLLVQVIVNLLMNAAQAIPDAWERPRVEVRLHHDADFAVLEVRDNGCGMDERTQRAIFKPFFTTKGNASGMGLGLALCREIVEGFRGTISVVSGTGQGSTFTVRIPIAPAYRRAVQEATPCLEAERSGRGRVLVIDDDAALARALSRALSRQHRVEVASGLEAIDAIRQGATFDAILCDLMMPDITGMEVHAQLTALAPQQVGRMIFITGGAYTPAATLFLETVQSPVLHKPLNMRMMMDAVAEIMEEV